MVVEIILMIFLKVCKVLTQITVKLILQNNIHFFFFGCSPGQAESHFEIRPGVDDCNR